MSALVIQGNARCLPLPDDSVDLIVTSPPYFALRSYQDGGVHYAGQVGAEATPVEFVDALIACTAEWMRVLKPSGSLWVNLGDKYAGSANGKPHTGTAMTTSIKRAKTTTGTNQAPTTDIRAKSLIGLPWRYALRCIDDLGLILRAEVIWSKPNGLPESVTDRVRRSHEQWFHLTAEPRYFSTVDEIREPYALGTSAQYARGYSPTSTGAGAARISSNVDYSGVLTCNPLGKLPGSVWTVPTQPLTVPAHLGVDHFAAFPMEWPRRLIKGWAPADGIVVDPFGGTGTTALVADTLGRTGISVDLSHDYSRLARWRTTEPAQRASALQVEKPPVEVDGQADLWDVTG